MEDTFIFYLSIQIGIL